MALPQIKYAIIGGSSTFSIEFPEVFQLNDLTIIEKSLIIPTPFGDSPPMKIFSFHNNLVVTCKMHGWRAGVKRGAAARQIFWIFKQMGVQTIFVEGGVGSINEKLAPRDLVIPDDYIDFSGRRTVSLSDDFLLIMRHPFCPNMRETLDKAVKNRLPYRNLFMQGVYCNTDGRHFESKAEVKMIANWGADFIGQSICPEVYLAREIGACYAGIYMVVNYAEGILKEWEYEELKDIFWQESKNIGQILLEALKISFHQTKNCQCDKLRRSTLLK